MKTKKKKLSHVDARGKLKMVDVTAKDGATAAVIAIPLVAAIVIAVAGAVAGLWYVRSRKRAPSAGKRAPGTVAQAKPSTTLVQGTATPMKAPGPARATNEKDKNTAQPGPPADMNNSHEVDEVTEVTAVEESGPQDKPPEKQAPK
jgi:hypothetical protein